MDDWAQLQRFMAKWHRPLEPKDGLSEEQIAQIETTIGEKLPEQIHCFCSLVGNCLEEFESQDAWVLPLDWKVDSKRRIEIVVENQHVVSWWVHLGEGEQNNPPVWVEDEENSATFSQFVLGRFAYETLFVGDTLCNNGACSPTVIEEINRSYYEIVASYRRPSFPTRFYESDELLVVTNHPQLGDSYGWIWVVAKPEHQQTFDRFIENFSSVDWIG